MSSQQLELESKENEAVPPSRPNLPRHSRKCQICHHPDRDAIEHAFVTWRRPYTIAHVYQISEDSLCRHAQAVDLYSRRRNNLRAILENVLERGVETEITGDTILKAVRAYTSLTDDNQWIEPASNVVFSTKPFIDSPRPRARITPTALSETSFSLDIATEASLAGQMPPPDALAISQLALATGSNRGSQELEIDVSH